MDKKYTYEDVKKAYMAVIEVGKCNVRLGALGAQIQHTNNLWELEGAALELYDKLMNDETINY